MNPSSVIREARSWLLPAIAAIPIGVLTAVGVEALPIGLQRPAWVVVSLLFWVVIWLIDRVPLFALASWLVPGLALIGLAHVSGVPYLFLPAVLAVVVVVAVISMYGRAWQWWAHYSGLLLQWIASRTLSPRDRLVCDQLVEEMRYSRREQLPDDFDARARAMREAAARLLALDPPDDAWAAVIRAAAEPKLAYAEMLEGRRPVDEKVTERLGRRRDELFYELLRSRSRVYRWLTVRLFGPNPAADGSPGK